MLELRAGHGARSPASVTASVTAAAIPPMTSHDHRTTADDLERRLDAAIPPAGASPALLAIWHGLHGQWDAAHALAQAQDDAPGAWVHAWLHRIEGDLANAGYWYRRAQQPMGSGDLRAEGLAIARALEDPCFK